MWRKKFSLVVDEVVVDEAVDVVEIDGVIGELVINVD